MKLLLAFSALEVILCIVVARKLRALQRLERELRRGMFDLRLAFRCAEQGKYAEAYDAAQRWSDRLRAMQRREPYHPPPPPPRENWVVR